MARCLVPGRAPRKGQLLVADCEVARVDNLGSDVDAILELEGDQVRFAVLEFVKSRFFTRGRPDVGERVVVIDCRDEKRLARRFRVE